jgi:hypothetical protein
MVALPEEMLRELSRPGAGTLGGLGESACATNLAAASREWPIGEQYARHQVLYSIKFETGIQVQSLSNEGYTHEC